MIPNWSMPGRRMIENYEEEIFIPSIRKMQLPKGYVVVDTSDSISDALFSKFIGIIEDLVVREKPEEVQVLFFSDHLLKDKTVIIRPNKIPKIKRPGGGGTEICDTIDYLDKNVRNIDFVVVLSDFDIFDNYKCMDKIEKIGARATAAVQVVPFDKNVKNKWKNWKQIVVDEPI